VDIPRSFTGASAVRRATSEIGDQLVALVEVEDSELRQFGGRGVEEIRDRGCPVRAPVGQGSLSATARSSIDGVMYSTGMNARGGVPMLARSSPAERVENPTSRRVTVVIRTRPCWILDAHSAASSL
jgi:hypothetical protein